MAFRHLHSATDTTVKIGVVSTSNAQVDVTLNGVTQNPTMTARGTDGVGAPTDSGDLTGPPDLTNAGYSGATTFSGLTAGTTYSFTVTQGGTTHTGTAHTSPTGRFVMWQVTCDGLHTDLDFPDKDSPTKYMYGMWPTIRADAENANTPDVVAILFPDDLGYRDTGYIDDTLDTGYFSKDQPKDLTTQYSYVLSDMAYMGLLQDFTNTGYAGTKLDSKGLRQNQFFHPDRFWCMENIAWYPGFGDHEGDGSQGEGVATTDAKKAICLNSFQVTLGIGAPAPLNSATNGWCYTHTIGPCEIITFDRWTQCGTEGVANAFNTTTQEHTGEPFLSTAQIDLITAAIDTTGATPWKIVSSPSDCHYGCSLADRLVYLGIPQLAGAIGMGHQQPIHGYGNDRAEWDRLMVHDGSSTTKGILKTCLDEGYQCYWLTGDRHYYGAKVHYIPASGTNCEERMLQLYSGSVNGKTAQYIAKICRSSHKSYAGSAWKYLPDWVPQSGTRPQHPSAIRIEVRQDLSPQEINFQIHDLDEGVVFETTAIMGEGNIPADLSYLKTAFNAGDND